MPTDEETRHAAEAQLAELKVRKSRLKAVFTRHRNKLIDMLDDEELTRDDAKPQLDKLEQAMNNYSEGIEEIIKDLKNNNKTEEMKKSLAEMDDMNQAYDEVVDMFNKCLSIDPGAGGGPGGPPGVSTDMYKQLKRVSIPVFSGVKAQYDFWQSAFSSCVDSTDATAEYKFLQLKQYLSGEALKAVEGLGHSAAAYEAAKERLERKYGGKRRKVTRFFEELNRFPVMKYENAVMINKFADLLDIAIINMKEHEAKDLNSGFMYLQLVKKMTQSMISRYERWRFEHEMDENVESLKEWVLKEAEFSQIAFEVKVGLDTSHSHTLGHTPKKEHVKTYFGGDKSKTKKQKQVCKLCNGGHGIWECTSMKMLPINSRWEKAKAFKLCFRCLGDDHAGRDCRRTRKCNIDGCSRVHHRLLHSESAPVDYRRNATGDKCSTNNPNGAKGPEITHSNTYVSGGTEKCIALSTVPVILKNGENSVRINALLDDGSTRTYINEDVAFELGAQTNPTEMTVNVLNGISDTFKTMPVKVGLESVNGQVKIMVDASTTRNVTGTLKTINWNEKGKTYPHLRGVQFPVIPNKSRVDMLIGSDYAQLHYSLHEIRGEPNEPIARLTPLGWTCVGPYGNTDDQSCFNTFFVKEAPELIEALFSTGHLSAGAPQRLNLWT